MSQFTKSVTGMLSTMEKKKKIDQVNSERHNFEIFGYLSPARILSTDSFTLQFDRESRVRIGYFELRAIAVFFGTENVDTDEYHTSGCDTCGYGAEDYTKVYVRDVTKNFPKCLFDGLQESLSEKGPGYPDEKTKAEFARLFTQG